MIEHLKALDESAKPHRRIYRDGDVYVKIHAVPRHTFGLMEWIITGSHCGSDGKALAEAGRYRILKDAEREEFQVRADSSIDVEAELETHRQRMVARVVNAVRLAGLDPHTASARTLN